MTNSKNPIEKSTNISSANDFRVETAASLAMESPETVEKILKKLEPEEQEMVSMFFSGPLPPPDILKDYAEIYPDAPEKLFN